MRRPLMSLAYGFALLRPAGFLFLILSFVFSLPACTAGSGINSIAATLVAENANKIIVPTLSISAPSSALASSATSVTYTVTYANATAVTLTLANITLVTTGGATCSVAVGGIGTSTRVVTLSSCAGTGTVGISLAAGTATNSQGAAAAGTSATFQVQGGPSLSVGSPSASQVNASGSVSYVVTYSNATSVSIASSYVSLSATGTASCVVSSVVVSGTTSATVTLSSCSGNGSVGIIVAAGSASNASGNSPSAGPSATFNVITAVPSIVIGAPSASEISNSGSANYSITYSNATAVNLIGADISLNSTGGVSCTIAVSNGTSSSATVTLSACSNSGTVGISISAGTASNFAGSAAAAGPSQTVTVYAPLTINSATESMATGSSFTFTATGGAGSNVYSSSSGSINSSTGVYTAPLSVGTSTVTVTDRQGNTSHSTVTVVQASLSISPTSVTLLTGESQTFTAASGSPAYTFTDTLSYITSLGLLTVPLTASAGTDTVTVNDSGGSTPATATVNIRAFQTTANISACPNGGGNSCQVTGMAVDSSGNVYAVGMTGYELLVEKSTNSGQTWTIVATTAYVANDESFPSIVIDSSNNIFVSYNPVNGGSGISGNDWYILESSNGGTTWTSADHLAAVGVTASYSMGPLAVDPSGNLYALGYLSNFSTDTTNLILRKSANHGVNWATVDTETNPGNVTGLAADGSGNVYQVISHGTPGTMYMLGSTDAWLVRKSSNSGSTWSYVDSGYQYATGAGMSANAVTIDPTGNVYVAGYGADSNGFQHWIVRKSVNHGSTWALSDDGACASSWIFCSADGLAITSDASGNIYSVGYSPSGGIAVRKYNISQGTWYTVDTTTSLFTIVSSIVANATEVYYGGWSNSGSNYDWVLRALSP